MEDYIYYILVIGWIVYGVIKASSKNKAKQNSAPSRPKFESKLGSILQNKTSSFEGLFKDFLPPELLQDDEMTHPYESTNDEIVPDLNHYSEKYASPSKLDSYSGSDNISSVFKQTEISDISNQEIDQVFDYQYEEDVYQEDLESFDLRQAIIYQVILERPY